MGSRVYNSFFAVVAAILVFQAPSTEAKFRDINKFCQTADYRSLCTVMVAGADNWHDAVSNAIHATLLVAKNMDTMLPLIEPVLKNLPGVSRESTLKTCKSNFEDTVDDLKTALEALEQDDKGGVNIHLSAVSVSDCIDAFQEFHTIFPSVINKAAKQLDRQIGVCLAVSQQI